MSKSNEALAALVKNWGTLKSKRPTEADFSTYGYPLSYESIDELFGRWVSILNVLDEKGYWGTSPEVAIADAPLAALLNELSSAVSSANENGISWLLSNRFLDISHTVQTQLSALSSKQISVNRQVAKLLADRSSEHLDEIISAARVAKSVISLEKQSAENARRIQDATEAIESASSLADSTNARLATLAKESEENAATVRQNKKEADKTSAEISSLKISADKREEGLSRRVEEVNKQLSATDETAKTAYKSVENALRKIREQGLAHSFQARSNSLQTERIVWTTVFIAAVVSLAVLAFLFAVRIADMTYQSLLVQLLRKIGLAAPTVWLGWYSARQVGRISRVQEDYEYKAASALAFQSYKEEAKVGNDSELEKKLLEHAIKTFGENPVRLYDDHTKDPVTPLQAAIKELPPEKIAAIMAAVGEQALRGKLWPLGK